MSQDAFPDAQPLGIRMNPINRTHNNEDLILCSQKTGVFLDAAASQSGVHHKMAAIMEDAFVKVEKVGGDIGKHKKKRKNPRTTLYILTSVYLILPCS
jgi:hypothetical protein